MNSRIEVSTNPERNQDPVATLVEAVSAGRPIFLEGGFFAKGYSAMGDIFIYTWAAKTVIEYVCRQHDVNNVPYLSYLRDNPSEQPILEFSDLFPSGQNKDLNPQLDSRLVVQGILKEIANQVGVQLPESVIQQKLKPFAFDHPKFNSWEKKMGWTDEIENGQKTGALIGTVLGWEHKVKVDEALIAAETTKLKEKLGDRKLIVINMAGSLPEKRFSFTQVQILAKKLRAKYPDSYIVVLSDAKTAQFAAERQNLKREELKTYDPVWVAMQDVANYRDAKVQTTAADHQLKINTADIKNEETYPLQADEFVIIQDLNQLAAYGEVTDLLVTSDTFWAWWMSQAKRMIVAYTIADDSWQVPGAEAVYSPAITPNLHRGASMIDTDEYRDHFQRKTGLSDNQLGMSNVELLKMVHKFDKLPDTTAGL